MSEVFSPSPGSDQSDPPSASVAVHARHTHELKPIQIRHRDDSTKNKTVTLLANVLQRPGKQTFCSLTKHYKTRKGFLYCKGWRLFTCLSSQVTERLMEAAVWSPLISPSLGTSTNLHLSQTLFMRSEKNYWTEEYLVEGKVWLDLFCTGRPVVLSPAAGLGHRFISTLHPRHETDKRKNI